MSLRRIARLLIICCSLLFVCAAFPQIRSRIVRGKVHDQLGAVVAGARITIQGEHYQRAASTGSDGSFSVQGIPEESVTLTVMAPGFARFSRLLSVHDCDADVELLPAPVSEQVEVTANRVETSLDETAQSVDIVSRQQLETTAAEPIDDALRQVPGFTLFRRSGSRTANPTSQGASLRGIGASGASRALVLYDGIPLNDPFGGWVYWGRIPRESVSSIEVLNGGASSLYGSGALGGVVNVFPLAPQHRTLSAEFSAGSQSTPDFSTATLWSMNQWSFGGSAEVFRTGGYVPVPAELRGSVDAPADSTHQTATATVLRKLHSGDVFVDSSFYDESRGNGTRLQTNDTQLWQMSGGLNLLAGAVNAQLRGYGSGQSYNQTFSSIAANRNSESLVRAQHVPAQQVGGSLSLSGQFGPRNLLVGGADTRLVRGFSNELVLVSAQPNSRVSAGGRQLSSGAFIQDAIRLHRRLLFTIGVRYDNWNNYDAQSQTLPLVASVRPNFTAFADQSEHAFSPRAALLFKASDHVSLNATAYKNFRAPTLNELYRAFRLGNVLTLANPQLQSERLSGIDAGGNIFLKRARVYATYFHMQVSNPVANVTLSSTPLLITRQRQNLGRTRSQGVETGMQWSFNHADISAGYQFVDAMVARFPSNRLLEGLEIPQIAPHQFTFQTRYNMPRGWTLAVQGRASSRQFDDDLNQFRLDSFFQLDAYVSKRLHNGVEVFSAIENLTNSRIIIARTPLVNVGPPIYGRIGVRVHFE